MLFPGGLLCVVCVKKTVIAELQRHLFYFPTSQLQELTSLLAGGEEKLACVSAVHL